MERKKASDFHPEVLKLFDGYVHGSLSRRDFLDRAAKFAVGGTTAAAILQSLSPNFAWAQQVAKDDPRIKASYIEYPSPEGSGTVKGYLALPSNPGGKRPAVIVIHENRGLNPYIEDVARRLAAQDYIALAPDALTPLGGYPGDEDKARELFPKLDAKKRNEDLFAAFPFLREDTRTTGRVGAVGFCIGGTIVNAMAVRFGNLAAGAPFYGGQPKAEDVPKINAVMQMHYAGEDKGLNAGIEAYEAALKAAGKKYEVFIYPGVQHGFHNDTTPRYDEAAAKLAWSRTLALFNANLR